MSNIIPSWKRMVFYGVVQGACLLLALIWFTGQRQEEIQQALQEQMKADNELAADQLADFVELVKGTEPRQETTMGWMPGFDEDRARANPWMPVQEMLSRLRLGKGRSLCLVDAQSGGIICHSQMANPTVKSMKPGLGVLPDQEGNKRLIDAVPRLRRGRVPFAGLVKLPDGIYLCSARRLPNSNLLALVLKRQEDINEAASQLAEPIWSWGLAGTGLLVLLTGLLTWYLSKRFQKRLDDVEDNIERVVQFRTAQLGKSNQEMRQQIEQSQRMEKALLEKEDHVNLVVQSIQDYAIFLLDSEGRVASWNAGAEQISGYTAEEISGQPFACFYREKDRERNKPESHLREADQSGRCEKEGWRLGKDGRRFWASVHLTPVRNREGNQIGYAVVMRDTTRAKNSQEALRLRDRALQNFSEGLLIADVRHPGQPVLYCNPAWVRLSGFSPEETLGQSLGKWFGPGEIDPVLIELRQAIEDRRPITVEGPGRRKDGTVFWSLTSVSVVANSRGRPCYLAIWQRDLTAQKTQEVQRIAGNRETRRLPRRLRPSPL